MRRFGTYFWRALAIAIALSAASLAGGREKSMRIVSVSGTRVHLRSGAVPLTLDHRFVKRHLYTGEGFAVERVAYGIGYDGHGTNDLWLFVRSVNDPSLDGWINGRYVVELAGHYPPDPAEAEPAVASEAKPATTSSYPSAPPAPAPASPTPTLPGIIPAPPAPRLIGLADNIVSVIASTFSILVSLLGLRLLFGRFRGDAAATTAFAPQVQPYTPNCYYGRGWHIRAIRRNDKEKP
jgi:hypothetical protein